MFAIAIENAIENAITNAVGNATARGFENAVVKSAA
jgi:hypothetical protein